MCGVSGVYTFNRSTRQIEPLDVAREMAARLTHRGPDAGGSWADEANTVALGHRRLSIIDTSSAGDQPMTSRSGRWVIAYNGELYNTAALRMRLSRYSISWQGHSDTEVLVEAIAHLGVRKTLEAAIGMFAFVLYDREHDEVWLARDRFGEKPLYFHAGPDCLVAASELTALLASPTVPFAIDRHSLVDMLERLSVPSPYTILQDVRKLEPGTFAKVSRSGKVVFERYFDPCKVALEQEVIDRSDEEALEEFSHLLADSVSSRMVSDVPLGAFLSGGIDSSLIVAMMQTSSSVPTRTFTIGFDVDELNEAPAARTIAARLGTEHHEWVVTGKDALAVVPELGSIYDEPFADSSQIPTILVSRFAREGLTVALTGDGGDEFFGGYTRYSLFERVEKMRRGPTSLRRAVARGVKTIEPDTYQRLTKRSPRWLMPGALRNRTGRRVHSAADMLASDSRLDVYDMLLLPHRRGSELAASGLRRARRTPLSDIENLPPTQLAMAIDTIDYLPNDILTKVDRASMSTSLETRAPFLDPEIFKFAWTVDPTQRRRGDSTKWLLRESVRRHVPEIAALPKRGFGVPLAGWLRSELREWAGDLLNESGLRSEGLLNAAAVGATWQLHLSGEFDASAELWPILMFESWMNENRPA